MILTVSIAAVAVLYVALRRNYISDYGIIIGLMSVVFIFSLFPSLSIPYILDDVDHFNHMAACMHTHQVLLWLFFPHNEHIIPLIKSIYLLCYHFFGLDPEAFHVVILGVIVGIIVLIYKLVLALTKNNLAALIGASLMAATNITDDALFIGTNSHIFFCMFLLLLLFYALYRYAQSENFAWRLTAFVAILTVPSTFALGLFSIFFSVLFTFLCIPEESRKKTIKLFPLLLSGWFFSLLPYVYFLRRIIHTDHYKYVHAASIFQVAHVVAPVGFLSEYIASTLVPGVFTNAYLAFGLFFLCVYTVVAFTKEIAWKRVLFFVLLGLLNNFIIYVFRIAWGAYTLDTPRYYVFPIVMIACAYPLILDIFIKRTPQIKRVPILVVVYLMCFFVVVNGAMWRYHNGDLLLKRTMVMQNLYVNFKKAFVDYFQEHPTLSTLKVKDGGVRMPAIFWPPSKPGMKFSISRFSVRNKSFYARYILSESMNDKIVWADKTDPDFLSYLNANQYLFLATEDKK